MRKHVLERTPRVWLDNHPIKRLPLDLISHLNRSQDYMPAKTLLIWIEGQEKGCNLGRLSNSGVPLDKTVELLSCEHALSFKKIEDWSWGWFIYQQGSPCHHRLRARRPKYKAVHSLVSEGGATSLVSLSRLPLLRASGAKPMPVAEWVQLPLRDEGARPFWWVWKAWLPPLRAWRAKHRAKGDYFWALKSNGICLARFWICWRPTTPFFFWFFPFGIGLTVYSTLIPPLCFEAYNLPCFTGS